LTKAAQAGDWRAKDLLRQLGEVGRFDEAITALQDAVATFRETGDRHGEGVALDNLGNALRYAGRFDEAITAHQDAVGIFRETGDRQGEDIVLRNLEVDQNAERA